MSTTRREFLVMVGAAGLLVACGTGGEDEAADTSAPNPEPPKTRSVTGDNGAVEVPAVPKRVVAAIGSFETDIVAVGVMPVLTTTFAGPWVELDEGVTITKNIPPTPEELAVAKPDLILGWNWVTEEES